MSENKTTKKPTEQKPTPKTTEQTDRKRLDPVRYEVWRKNEGGLTFKITNWFIK